MIQVLSHSFEDIFGNELSFLQANALDRVFCKYDIAISIEFTSSNSELVTATLPYQLGLYSGDWEEKGFREGDLVTIEIYDISNTLVDSENTTITNITGGTIQFTSLPATLSNGQLFDSTNKLRVVSASVYDELDIYSNFVPNGTTGASESLIDGENTVDRFIGLSTIPVSTSFYGITLGKRSGQFETFSNLEFTASDGSFKYYTITVETHVLGILDPTVYLGASCLKHYIKFVARRNAGETFGLMTTAVSYDANTGNLDEAFNLGVLDSELVGTDILSVNGEVNYDQSTNIRFTIDSSSTYCHIGAMYVPLDNSYNHNKYLSQSNFCILSESFTPYTVSGTVYPSKNNPVSANYTLTLGTISSVGTITEYQVIFEPNLDFTNFIASKPDGDRRFVIWFKCGNVNLTIFDGQLSKAQNPWGDLSGINAEQFIRHDENQNTPVTDDYSVIDFDAITEDDLGYLLSFTFNKSIFYKEVRVFIEAYNTVTTERFDLERASFDLSATPVVSGKQLINLNLGVSNNLPTTSAKKQALLINDPTVPETISEYAVRLYYPFLVRWEYWLTQIGVNTDFYPFNGKNWFEYGDLTNWQVQITTQAITSNDRIFSHSKKIGIRDYNDNPFITHTRKLYKLDGTEVSAFIDGEVLEIRDDWENVFITLDGIDMYGTIHVEAFEDSPRWDISTKVPTDFNPNNPLFPITGNLATVTLINPNKVRVSCYIDCNKLDLSRDVSINSRIALNFAGVSEFILLEDGFIMLQENNDKLIIE